MRLPTAFRLFVLLVGSAATAAAQCVPCTHNGGTCIHWSQGPLPNPNGHTIPAGTIEFADVPSFTINGTLTIQGTLIFNCSMGVTLQCNRIEVQNGGKLEIGTPGARAVGPVVIRLAGAAPPVQPPQRTLEVQPGGTLELHGWTNGNTTCWTQLANHANPGQSSLDLALLAPMNWINGDKIVLASTDFPKVDEAVPASGLTVLDQTEQLTVASMNGTVVDTQEPILYFHHGHWIDSSVDARAEVGLLNRSIRIEGYPNPGEVRLLQSPTQSTQIHIDWTEFTNLGAVGLGYPLHFHLMGSVTGSYVKYCSFHHNLRNSLVIHETSNLLVEGNVFYDTIGWHVWFQESKPECHGNILSGNLALVAREDTTVVQNDLPTDELNLGDAACFYLRNLDNSVIGNHAGSSWASGFYIDTVEVESQTNYFWTKYHTNPTFIDNVAHSCADHGFYLGGFTEFHPWQLNIPDAVFSNFTSYKNNAFGVHCRNFGTCVWDNAQLADNGSGVYFASSGFWTEDYRGINRLTGGKVIGESTSNLGLVDIQNPLESAHGRSLPTGRAHNTFEHIWRPGSPWELIGFSVYDGLILVDGTAFKAFNNSPPPPNGIGRQAGAFGATMYANPWAIDPRNTVMGCTFDSSSKVWVRPYSTHPQLIPSGVNNVVIHDKDGCIANPPAGGSMFCSGNALLQKAPQTARTPLGGTTFLHDGRPFGQVILFEGDDPAPPPPYSFPQRTITVSYNGGMDTALHVNLSGGSWPATFALHAWNTVVSLPAPGPVPPLHRNVLNVVSNGPQFVRPITLMLSGNTKDSMADFEIPFASATVPPTVRVAQSYAAARAGTVLQERDWASFSAALETAYHYNTNTNTLYLRIKLPLSTAFPGWSQWGSMFDGAPLYVRVE